MKRNFLILALLCLFNIVFAQEVKNLPRDPRIKIGKMANGFSYYLIKNDKISGYADFYLVQKVGYSLESDEQKGMTSIIGDMGVRGTRNFPGYTILSYIDQLGMELGSDMKIINGQNESIYKLASVPVGRSKLVVDSTLLILFNWACSINIDEEDVDKEKEYCKNVFVEKMDVERRCEVAHKNNVLAQAGYNYPSPLMMLEKFDKYTSKELRNYYYKWYRPERQALIVVGDIDTLSLDTQIKTLFQATPKYLEPNKEKVYTLPNSKKTEISLVRDKEATFCDLNLYFNSTPLPFRLRASAVPYVMGYMNDMMTFLLNDRLLTVTDTFKEPIVSVNVTYGDFMGLLTKEALRINVKTFPSSAENVLNLITREIYRIKKYGFTKEEFVKARERYYKNLNYLYDWRIFTPNDVFVNRCSYNFFQGYHLASIEMNKEYMDIVRYEIGLNQFNTFVSSYLRTGDNCVITCSLPDNKDDVVFSEEKLENIFSAAVKSLSEPYFYKPVSDNKTELDYKAGTIVSENKEMITDSKLWNLSNGATVVFKPTQAEPDKFHFCAVAKGGMSLIKKKMNLSPDFINELAGECKLGNNNAVSVERLLREKEMHLDKKIDLSTSSLYGDGYASNLKDMMELIFLHFSKSEMDTAAVRKFKAIKKEELKYYDNSPENIFADSLNALIYIKNSIISGGKIENIDEIDYQAVFDFIKERYSNAANYTFIFSGDIQEPLLKDYICKYIASLDGNSNKKETWVEMPLYLDKYGHSSTLEMNMELPRSIYNMTLSGAAPNSMESNALHSIVSRIIEKKVQMNLMDNGISATYKSDFKKYPEEFLTISFSFVSENNSERYFEVIESTLNELEINGADAQEIGIIKSGYQENFKYRQKTDNTFWTDILVNRFIYGKDFYTKRLSYISSLSDKAINDALKTYLENCAHSHLTMSSPER